MAQSQLILKPLGSQLRASVLVTADVRGPLHGIGEQQLAFVRSLFPVEQSWDTIWHLTYGFYRVNLMNRQEALDWIASIDPWETGWARSLSSTPWSQRTFSNLIYTRDSRAQPRFTSTSNRGSTSRKTSPRSITRRMRSTLGSWLKRKRST